MQVCTSLQTDNHASIPPLSFFKGRMPFLPPNQQRQSTEGIEALKAMLEKLKIKFKRLIRPADVVNWRAVHIKLMARTQSLARAPPRGSFRNLPLDSDCTR